MKIGKDLYELLKEGLMDFDIIEKNFGKQNWNDYTKEELDEIGFRYWNRETGLLLIPYVIFKLTEDGTELKCISGSKTYVYGKDYTDDDHRGGLVAFGVIKK